MKKVLTYFIFAFALLSCQDKIGHQDLAPAAISFSSPGVDQAKSILIEDKSQLAIGGDMLGYSVFAARG